jgi:hypothetical protein
MMRRKYGNRKIHRDGEVFDSKREFERYQELLWLERAGRIHDLHRQVKFELVPAFYEPYERRSEKTGKLLTDGQRCIEKAVNYYADFVYWEGDEMVVEDVKSEATKTEAYIIKRKLMCRMGYRIREVE